MEESDPVDEGGKVFTRDEVQVINLILEVAQLAIEIWGMMDEEMLKHRTTIFVSDVML